MNKTVVRIANILDYIAKSERCPTISNISRDLDIPKSSTFDIIHTLLELDFLTVKDSKIMSLGLGIKAFEIGHQYLHQIEFWEVIHSGLEQLVSRIKKSVFFWSNETNDMVVLDFLPHDRTLYPNVGVGFRKSIFDGGSGKVYIASLTDEKIGAMLPGGFSKEAWMDEICRIRENGYYVSDKDMIDNETLSISVPVFNYQNQCCGVITIYDLKSRITNGLMETITCETKNTALSISQQMGYLGKKLYPF